METINDIVHEIRAQQNGNVHTISAKEAYALADRIEAAVVRENRTCQESLQVGNAAAMREALRKCANYLDVGDAGLSKGECDALREVMQEALSVPPRNCDLYATEAEAYRGWERYYNSLDKKDDYLDFENWLFDEAKGK